MSQSKKSLIVITYVQCPSFFLEIFLAVVGKAVALCAGVVEETVVVEATAFPTEVASCAVSNQSIKHEK